MTANVNDKDILDAVADTAIDTLEQYKVLVGQSRFVEANECLGLIERLTSQAHRIEDHTNRYTTPAQVAAATRARMALDS